MIVRYKGSTSEEKPLPGGGAQGTLLGLLLFLVLINDCGFKNQPLNIGKTITEHKRKFLSPSLHVKFIDDLTLLEAFNLEQVQVVAAGGGFQRKLNAI